MRCSRLPLAPEDLKARLPDFAQLRGGGGPQPKAGDGILDPLTNFYTFSHFKEVLFVEVKRARRYGFPLAHRADRLRPGDGEAVAEELREPAARRARARHSPLAARHRLPGAVRRPTGCCC